MRNFIFSGIPQIATKMQRQIAHSTSPSPLGEGWGEAAVFLRINTIFAAYYAER